MTRSALFVLVLPAALLSAPLAARAQSDPPPHPLLDDAYVVVTSNAAPCSIASPSCTDRVIVALGDLDVRSHGTIHSLERGQIVFFQAGESYEIPGQGRYYEVVLKPDRPPLAVRSAARPLSSAVLYENPRVMVYQEMGGGAGPDVAHDPISHRLVIRVDGDEAVVIDLQP